MPKSIKIKCGGEVEEIQLNNVMIDFYKKETGKKKITDKGLVKFFSKSIINKNIVNNNVGFLAISKEEWVVHFTTLILDQELQKSMGKNGHALVKKEFNRDLVFRLILDLIESHL